MLREQGKIPPPHVNRRGLQSGDALRAGWENPAWRKWKTEVDMTGRSPSGDTREKIALAKRGVDRGETFREKMSRTYGAVKIIAGPLLLRGASAEDVVQITDFAKTQVDNLISNMRRSEGGLETPTSEQTSLAKRNAHLGKPRQGERVYRYEEQCAFALVHVFAHEELFADLATWNELQEHYRNDGRELPQTFAAQLRLEVFLQAIKLFFETGDKRFLRHYAEIGEAIDASWFNDPSMAKEEEFLIDKLLPDKMAINLRKIEKTM